MNTYLAVDAEFAWDEHLFEAHRSIDRKSDRRTTAVKRVIAVAAYEFSVDEEGCVATGSIAAWTEYDWGLEAAVVYQLFDHLRSKGNTPILTFGGAATDVPVLTLAATANGYRLPPQLVDQPGRRGPRPHVDLALQLKGCGRTFTHLSQLLLRLGVPIELVSAKPAVTIPNSREEWQSLKNHVELDTLQLAIAKLAWLTAQGAPGLWYDAGAIALIGGFLRRNPDHTATEPLIAYSCELERECAERVALLAA